MNPEIKKDWVAALRSGQYKQGQNRLHADDRFCCLGVLCDITRPITGGMWLELPQYRNTNSPQLVFDFIIPLPSGGQDRSTNFLPTIVMRSCQLDGISEKQLIQMNDDGWTFAEIADWIEANL